MTRLELAIVGLICVGVAWLFVPNLLTARERGRMKRTMNDLRTVATAVESYAIDHPAYPRVDDIDELPALLEPRYAKRLPLRDGWGTELRFESNGVEYTIASAGRDRRWMREGLAFGPRGQITMPKWWELLLPADW